MTGDNVSNAGVRFKKGCKKAYCVFTLDGHGVLGAEVAAYFKNKVGMTLLNKSYVALKKMTEEKNPPLLKLVNQFEQTIEKHQLDNYVQNYKKILMQALHEQNPQAICQQILPPLFEEWKRKRNEIVGKFFKEGMSELDKNKLFIDFALKAKGTGLALNQILAIANLILALPANDRPKDFPVKIEELSYEVKQDKLPSFGEYATKAEAIKESKDGRFDVNFSEIFDRYKHRYFAGTDGEGGFVLYPQPYSFAPTPAAQKAIQMCNSPESFSNILTLDPDKFLVELNQDLMMHTDWNDYWKNALAKSNSKESKLLFEIAQQEALFGYRREVLKIMDSNYRKIFYSVDNKVNSQIHSQYIQRIAALKEKNDALRKANHFNVAFNNKPKLKEWLAIRLDHLFFRMTRSHKESKEDDLVIKKAKDDPHYCVMKLQEKWKIWKQNKEHFKKIQAANKGETIDPNNITDIQAFNYLNSTKKSTSVRQLVSLLQDIAVKMNDPGIISLERLTRDKNPVTENEATAELSFAQLIGKLAKLTTEPGHKEHAEEAKMTLAKLTPIQRLDFSAVEKLEMAITEIDKRTKSLLSITASKFQDCLKKIAIEVKTFAAELDKTPVPTLPPPKQ